eukprot:TRINITY_DN37936_c0_g1_i1.p1 TRINITY_DN37936_c0_g1~~TRINITY_DN37936_c0_g1_i1.p1  ORF type:complete len:255 (+),score=11.62 TRINITY_DN37936_c0_g1_i1:74-838(+)
MDAVPASANRFLTDGLGSTMQAVDYLWWAVLVIGVYSGFWGYVVSPPVIHHKGARLPEGKFAKHEMDSYDRWCVMVNKFITVIFTYHTGQWAWVACEWNINEFALFISIAQLISLFIIYEFFYYMFHRGLHHPSVYPVIHKHHHQQHSPFRGNTDAINTHPFEFIVGNYDHLFSLYLVSKVLFPLNILTVVAFIVIGGYAASLNHTRFAAEVTEHLFSVSAHDVHHRVDVNTNYGQYIMLWDVIFGTYKRDAKK